LVPSDMQGRWRALRSSLPTFHAVYLSALNSASSIPGGASGPSFIRLNTVPLILDLFRAFHTMPRDTPPGANDRLSYFEGVQELPPGLSSRSSKASTTAARAVKRKIPGGGCC